MLIVVAHGSRNPAWRASVERQIELLQANLGTRHLMLAYMDLSPPTLENVVSEAVGQGVTHIRILPLFLAHEGHVDKDVRPMVEQIQNAYGSTDVTLLPPIGQHPLFLDLLRTLATEEQ